ncbi:SPW repeat protein [Haloterrigena sp. SYSU A558-1]|uniref:SPW repeat protein n=1 Tax=Haloterrigena gelatinilytica TaxID=2741724 RepID=A0A8J8GRQ5_9EURY|nr:SPW repeat protein [Haloterrigena gelatinilytica]NUB92315.1 SPW repeat protein [Haloterrigena gelatinilytica]NUC71861.1 SPW repeat protein [Haloterrigena gelatinilytica]
MHATAKLTGGGNGMLGCWLLAAPFVLGAPAVGRWNDVIVGTVVLLVVGYGRIGTDSRPPASATGAGLVAILGLWLLLAPFVLGFEGLPLWNDVVAGTVVTSFGSYDAYDASVSSVGRERSGRTPVE